MDHGPAIHVMQLVIAAAAREPVELHESLELVEGVGVAGDRYAAGTGHWSDPKWPDQQLTLIEAELGDELGLDASLLRRNIVTRGGPLDALIGVEFRIGSATLVGVRPCDPCRYLATLVRPSLFRELRGRGGIRAAILSSGTVRVGDAVVALTEGSGVGRA
jgi:MOSC domain-containing protein YiiM